PPGGGGVAGVPWPVPRGGALRPPRACTPDQIAVIRLQDDKVLAQVQGPEFALIWRHSVTLTPVQAEYLLMPDGQIIQTAERFEAHGPGVAHDGAGWRSEAGKMVIDLHRPIPRLILRSAPQYEKRLFAGDAILDLTKWPAIPLEIRVAECKEED
ncbi:MAG: DUF1850 domain-containing protein, partial [Roseinatronobacter sp.]|nr:DUF1850 domain-containing protein [Roseinatronobacter sp.]